MSERTDEHTVEGDGDVDLDGLVDDGGGATGDVGFDDDDLGVDVDALTSDPGTATDRSREPAGGPREAGGGQGATSGPGLLSRLRPSIGIPNPFAALPSPKSLAVSLGVVLVSMLLFGAFLPLGDVGSILGIFVGAFLLGILSGKQRYLELLASGAVAAAVSVVLGRIFLSAVADLAVPLAAVGAGGGALAALLGHYFGRDLRNGLTRSVD